jgi:SAM-dependent methyltransferase
VFPREFYYHLLAPLRGKDVLEIAAGNGIDACIGAHNGANVHAYDISDASVQMIRRRARVNGVSQRVKLQVTGDFTAAFPGQRFDAVIGYAALHHIPLEGLAQQVYDRLKPGGVAVFAEPVINSRWLHRLRRLIPYHIFEPTEDEQPLDDRQIARFARPFDRVVRREFQLLRRVWPMFPNNWPLAWALHHIDHGLLKIPLLRRFATVVVFGLYRAR